MRENDSTSQLSPILLDCTLRDGGYYNNWDFSQEIIKEYLHAMAAVEVDYVELGLRSFNVNEFKGGAAFSTDGWIRSLNVPEGLQVAVMINASELLNHQEGIQYALQHLFRPASDSPVSLVRIACHMHELKSALTACSWLKDRGYLVGMNLMQIADRSPEEVVKAGSLCSEYPLDVLYFADSMGGMDPDGIADVIQKLRVHWRGALGIHTHDNMGLALSNSLRAMVEGVLWVDSTVAGMGRGPGNVKTEHLLLGLERRETSNAFNIAPLLTLVQNYFRPMQVKFGWGPNPYYYLSGKFGIHPTYIQEMLNDSRYEPEEILLVIDYLKSVGGKKFNAHALESIRQFYGRNAQGTWDPSAEIGGRDVLILAAGPGATAHRVAIENYIRQKRPYVMALNAQIPLDQDLIDVRVACHPMRLLAECKQYSHLSQPLITPASMLPESILRSLDRVDLRDFGLSVVENTFSFFSTYSTLPNSNVIAYALAIATSGKAKRILLVGFDGFGSDDPRTTEMDDLLALYQRCDGALPLLSITPTRYKVPETSVYAFDDV